MASRTSVARWRSLDLRHARWLSTFIVLIVVTLLASCKGEGDATPLEASLPDAGTPTPDTKHGATLLLSPLGERFVAYNIEAGRLQALPFLPLLLPEVDLEPGRGISSSGWLAARVLGPGEEVEQLSIQIVNALDGSSREPFPLLSDKLRQIFVAGGDGMLPFEDVSDLLLGDRAAPLWSPDGGMLAFGAATQGDTSDVYLYDLTTDQVRRLTDESDHANVLAWSPDSRRIVFSVGRSFPNSGYETWLLRSVDAESGRVVTLLRPGGTGAVRVFGWATDDDAILAFHEAAREEFFQLQMINARTSRKQPLLSGPLKEAAVDPASRTYAVILEDHPDLGSGVFLGSLDQEGLKRVFDWGTDGDWYDLAWLDPPGVFRAASSEGGVLFDPEGGSVETFPLERCSPDPSPSGAYIVFHDCDAAGIHATPRLYERGETDGVDLPTEPLEELVWLPDSSGVIARDRDGEILEIQIPGLRTRILHAESAEANPPSQTAGTPSGVPTPQATSEVPQPVARWSAGTPLLFSRTEMITADVGWAIAAEQVNAVLHPTHHVLRTEDGGESWWEVTPPEEVAPSNSVRLVAVGFFLDAQHAWVTLGNDSLKRPIIWHTADGGLSWEAATISTRGGRYPSNPTFDFPDPDHGWLLLDSATGASSSEQDVLRTADGGRTWENVLQQGYGMGPITGIDFRDSQTGWVTNSHGLGFFPSTWITRTSDGGVRWAETVSASMEDPNAVLGRHCLLSQPMSENALRGRALWTCSTGEIPPVEFYLGWTEDGGTNWKHVRIPGTPYSLGKISGWALGLAEPDSSDGMASVLYRTSSGGLEWYEVSRLPWFGALDFATGQDGWAIDDGGLLRTRDGGKTWVSLDARLVAPPGMPSDITTWVDPSWSLSKISSANASDVLQLSEFHAPSPVSLVAGRSAVYVGLTNGRVAVWDWTDPESVPATLPLLRISDFPIYDLDAPQEALGFAAASLDGHAYSYEAWQWFELDILPSPDGEISGVAASIHGIFTSGEDGIVRLWERAEAAEGAWEIQQEHPGHIGWAWDVDTSPQGEFVASGGSDRTVRLGSAADDEPWKILEGHTSVVTKVRFPFHAVQLAAASRDGSIRVWDTLSGESLFVLLGHKDWAMDLAYSPDDTLLASADASGEVILWDVAGRKELFRWQAHQGAARAIAFLPDGRILLTAGDDGTVRIWGIQP